MSLRGLSRKLTVLDLLFAPQLHSAPSSALLSLGSWPVWTPFLGSLTFQFGLGLAKKSTSRRMEGKDRRKVRLGILPWFSPCRDAMGWLYTSTEGLHTWQRAGVASSSSLVPAPLPRPFRPRSSNGSHCC